MNEDWVATRFLLRLRADEQDETRRPLTEYLAEFPGHEELVAREFVLATADAAPPDEPGGNPRARAIGPFRLVRELGRGSQGIVHLAEDVRWRRLVALKVLLDGDRAGRLQMMRETVAQARVQHPGIAAFLEAGEDNEKPWIAMQYVPGASLRERLEQERHLSVREATELASRLADALHAAHERGLVHRDVKPSNVIVGPDGPVLLDLGLAHDVRGALPTIARGEACGTPDYMAPEQVEDRGPIDRRVDIWALGVVLFECVTGTRPYAAPTRDGICHAILNRELEIPLNVDRRLRAILTMALQRDPARRYLTTAAMADDLRRHAAGEPVTALLPGPVERCATWARKHPIVSGAVAAAGLALTAGLLTALTFLGREAELRQRSERAFADVRAMARTLAFDVYDELRDVDGATTARHLVLERARDLFERLVLERDGDPALEVELISSLTRLGDVLGHSATDNLGALDDARTCYERAANLAESCWQSDDLTIAGAGAALVAFLKVADARSRSDVDSAFARYAFTIAKVEEAERRFGQQPRFRGVEAAAELNRGALAQALGQRETAAGFLAASTAIVRQLAADSETGHEFGDQFATTLAAYGRALVRLERPNDGIALLREALATNSDPRFEVRRATHAQCCLILGTILLAGDEPGDGAELLATAVELRHQIVADNPANVSAALDLASAHFERAMLVESRTERDIAAAWSACRSVEEARPELPRLMIQKARLHLLAAEFALARPDPARTVSPATELAAAKTLVDALRRSTPNHPDLAMVVGWIAHITALLEH